jgi:Holliday junction resolvasome RuvABC endonuclease subunit
MNLKNIVHKNDSRVLSVDPSSHSLGWAVIDFSSGLKLIDCGKIKFTKTNDISIKFNEINSGIKQICKDHNPSVCVIEQSVYIQNFQTSRVISYIIGYTWGIVQTYCFKVIDINPILWKRGIGYKNISKNDKIELNTEAKKKKERKDRVRQIVIEYFHMSNEALADDDIVDAVGIGLWYYLMAVSRGS